MRLWILFSVGIILGIAAQAQDSLQKSKPFNFSFHGFVKSDYWYDSRQVVQSREGLFGLFPAPVVTDRNGNDINSHPSFNYSAISTRVNVDIVGPNAFGAKTTAFIEADFTGISNQTINTLRLRHAWMKLQWKHTSIVLGQDWHPMFVTEVFPGVLALNTGAPFQPFIRNPQIRIEHQFKVLTASFTALSQRDNSCNGPIGRDFSYMSNSLLPNLHAQLSYRSNRHLIGLAYDWKSIMPRLVTDSNLFTSNKLNTSSAMIYHRFSGEKLTLKSKVIYGENLTEHLMLGGYAVAKVDSLTDKREYTPTQHIFVWTNILFKLKAKKLTIQPGLFLGYAQNLGTKSENIGLYYSTGADIEKLWRISPSLSITQKPVMLTFEWELTRTFYGVADKSGIVQNSNPVDNQRFMMAAFYLF